MVLDVRQDGPKPGAVLMAEDADLLDQAEHDNLRPLLRFYEWDQPTVSLGFHQSAEQLDLDRLAASNTPWVRRPTGGAAVLHSEELTYAIVLPNCGDPARAAGVQERVSRAITNGLRAVGVPAETDERGEPLSALPNRASCFVRTSRWEVTVHGRKIVGSAQRKLSRALLQHGSILTGDDHLRITDFLSVRSEEDRSALRARLSRKATSLFAELGHQVDLSLLRETLSRSFIEIFADVNVLETTVVRG